MGRVHPHALIPAAAPIGCHPPPTSPRCQGNDPNPLAPSSRLPGRAERPERGDRPAGLDYPRPTSTRVSAADGSDGHAGDARRAGHRRTRVDASSAGHDARQSTNAPHPGHRCAVDDWAGADRSDRHAASARRAADTGYPTDRFPHGDHDDTDRIGHTGQHDASHTS